MLLIRALILFLSFQLPLGAVEVKFKGLVNEKDFTLKWSGESNVPVLSLERGREGGYSFKRVNDRWQVLLPGEHAFYLNEYHNNGFTHLVLMEVRREKFHYHAWSFNESEELHWHDLENISDLPVADSLDSSQGLTFDFKKVLRVPYTDKFFSFTHVNSEYLKCLYLGKLVGEANDEETCLRFERFSKGLELLGKKECRTYLYNESLSFKKVVSNEGSILNCLNLASSLEQGCFKSYIQYGGSLQNCLAQEKLTEFTQEVVALNCEDGDSYCHYLSFLKRKLALESELHFNYDDVENNRTLKITLPLTASIKLSLSNCYFQFLSTKELEVESAVFANEAYDSCRASYLDRQERPTSKDKTYFAKWVVELVTGATFGNLVDENVSQGTDKLSYWLMQTFESNVTQKEEYAQFLLKRGFLERALKQEKVVERSDWRAPASVSQ